LSQAHPWCVILLSYAHDNFDRMSIYVIVCVFVQEKDPGGRWFAYDQYPYEKWPSYANGPGIFLGQTALSYISSNKESLNRIRVDDAAVVSQVQQSSFWCNMN
jgi:hypothetical protein